MSTDYRGIEQHLTDGSDLRAELGPRAVPDHSTLQKAADRPLEKTRPTPCRARPSPPPTPAG